MANYETIIITRQDVSAAQVETLIDEMSAILTQAGGTIARREYWGLRSLAFRIRKNRKGHYTLLNYSVDTAAKDEMERLLGLNTDVLRHMTLVTENLPEEQSVILKERAYAEARPERTFDRGTNDRGGNDRGGYDRPKRDYKDNAHEPARAPIVVKGEVA